MTKVYLIKRALFFTLLFAVSSCGVNSDLMLKTPKDYTFESLDSLRSRENNEEYILQIDDIIQFSFQITKGSRILDMSAGTLEGGGAMAGQQMGMANQINYVVQPDSLVKLPYIHEVNLVGKTIREAEFFLEESYKNYYQDPFVQITVINKRVLVFPGTGGDAQVVTIANNNTTLIEAIALAGGIADRGRASKIKLIRDIEGDRKVYLIDLSKIEGLQHVDLIVQNGDYIYIEPTPQVGREILREIAPVFSLFTSSLALIVAINNIQ